MQATATKPETKTTDIKNVPRIQVSYDYGLFKLMGGNREIDYNHVKRLKKSMQAHPDLSPSNAIEVNEHYYIIDGQHRRMAWQELGMPVYFIVNEGGTLEDTRIENVTQKSWTLLDFAKSYADSGHEDYKLFLQLYEQYRDKLTPNVVRMVMVGGSKNALSDEFRAGEFAAGIEERVIRRYLDFISYTARKLKTRVNTPLASALLQIIIHNKEFDVEKFYHKLEMEHAVERFVLTNTIRQNLRSIEDVYNFQSQSQIRLY